MVPSKNNAKKSDTEDKRVLPRIEISGHVYIDTGRGVLHARLNNLSASGIFIDKHTAVSVGTEVQLSIKSLDIGNIDNIKGKVVRIETKNRRGLAIQFLEIDEAIKKKINSFIYMKQLNPVFIT